MVESFAERETKKMPVKTRAPPTSTDEPELLQDDVRDNGGTNGFAEGVTATSAAGRNPNAQLYVEWPMSWGISASSRTPRTPSSEDQTAFTACKEGYQ